MRPERNTVKASSHMAQKINGGYKTERCPVIQSREQKEEDESEVKVTHDKTVLPISLVLNTSSPLRHIAYNGKYIYDAEMNNVN
jgi:hypothetical protein